MTQEDYELIADIISNQRERLTKKQFEKIVSSFTARLSCVYQNFNYDRFIKVCYVDHSKEETK